MAICHIHTREYDVDISRLLARRLRGRSPKPQLLDEQPDSVAAQIFTPDEMEVWCAAVEELLLKDLSHFELARMVDRLPITLCQKQRVLPEAIKQTRSEAGELGILRGLRQHFSEYDLLNLEGFMRFRMQDALVRWEGCIDQAAEELLLEEEYFELMRILGAFVNLQPPRVKEVSLCIHSDGSYTLSDDTNVRIEYEPGCRDGLIRALVNLSPERITVYDLSGGTADDLSAALKRVFVGRIRVYR